MRNRTITVKDCVQRRKWIKEPKLEVVALLEAQFLMEVQVIFHVKVIMMLTTSYMDGAGFISGSRGPNPEDDGFEIRNTQDVNKNGMEIEFSEPDQINVSQQRGEASKESHFRYKSDLSNNQSDLHHKSDRGINCMLDSGQSGHRFS